MTEIKVDWELSDYETINGELYIRAKGVAKAVMGSPNFTDNGERDFLVEDLGIDEEGDRL